MERKFPLQAWSPGLDTPMKGSFIDLVPEVPSLALSPREPLGGVHLIAAGFNPFCSPVALAPPLPIEGLCQASTVLSPCYCHCDQWLLWVGVGHRPVCAQGPEMTLHGRLSVHNLMALCPREEGSMERKPLPPSSWRPDPQLFADK